MKKSWKLPRSFYTENRNRFVSQLEDYSAAVFFAGEAPLKTGDDTYVFTPNRNFLYLTGIDAPKIIYMCVKTPGETVEAVFVERSDEKRARWVGRSVSPREAADLSGVSDVMYIDEFNDCLTGLIFSRGVRNLYLDLENRFGRRSGIIPLAFWEEFSKDYPKIALKDGGEILYQMRGVKQGFEIECIKEAIRITGVAFEHIMNSIAPGMYEYQIESCFDFALKYNGVRERAFDTIIAGGKNATILHYSINNAEVSDNSLVLMDFGATCAYYSADITRTIPVNGRFTERQKELYNIVLEGQAKVLEAVRPGVTIFELNSILIDYYKIALKGAGLIGKRARGTVLDKLVEKYYWHKVGHALGLDTHDCAPKRDIPLEPGMVITVEPGLYVENEGIGIRIEDDILVTENGYINLSESIPKTVDELERGFREAGEKDEP